MRNKNQIIIIQVSKQKTLNTVYSSSNALEIKKPEVATGLAKTYNTNHERVCCASA